MLDAMSLSVSQGLCTQRQPLPTACWSKAMFVLPMESTFSLT